MVGFRNRKQRLWLLAIVAGLGFGFWYLLGVPEPAETARKTPFQIDKLIQLTQVEDPASLPVRLEYQILVQRKLPYLMAGGSGCYNRNPVRTVFKLVYEDYYIIIDPGPDERNYQLDPGGQTYARHESLDLIRSFHRARSILFSWPGSDTMGLAARAQTIYHFRDQLLFTSAQLRNRRTRQSGFPPAVLEVARQIDYKENLVLQPGLVLLRPENVQSARQWFVVHLQDGTRFLILDPMLPSLDCLQARSNPNRLHLLLEGKQAYPMHHFDLLNTLNQSKQFELLNGSDAQALQQLQRRGLIQKMN